VSEAVKLVDYVYVIADGVVAGEGTPEEMLTSKDPYVYQFMHAQPDGPIASTIPDGRSGEELGVRARPARMDAGGRQSTRMFFSRMILPHFTVSDLISSPNCSGVPATISALCTSNFPSCRSGEILASVPLSRSMTGRGVPAGAITPTQEVVSKPG